MTAEPRIAIIRTSPACRRYPICATPSGAVWGWDGPIEGAKVVTTHEVDDHFFILGDADTLAVPVRDVLVSRSCFADQVERPDNLRGRDGEDVFVYHCGYLRPARVSMNVVEPSVGVSWEDADYWTHHVKVSPGWGEVVEAYHALAEASAESNFPIKVDVPFAPHCPTLESLVMSGPNNMGLIVRVLREAVEDGGYGSIWELPFPMDSAAEAFLEELARFSTGSRS